MIKLLVILLAQTPVDFADFLYSQGDYSRAALEYERIGVNPATDTSLAVYSLLKAGEALLRKEEKERALNVFAFGLKTFPNKGQYFNYGLLRSNFYLNKYRRTDSIASLLRNSAFKTQALTYDAFSLGFLGKKQEAVAKFALLEAVPYRDSAISVLTAPLDSRSPWLSAGFSTVLPGLGQAYCGRWGDAWQSFSLVATFAGAAAYYAFFSKDTSSANTTKIIVTASIGGLFWLGNIYGAANAALDYNDYQQLKQKERLKVLVRRFDLEPKIPRP